MNKRKIIILLSSVFFVFSSIVVLASFVFQKIIDVTSTTGVIEVTEMKFGNYSNPDDIQYQEAEGKYIACYATEKKGWANETDDIYLNQLSLKFSYKTTIDVYVRIHIQDAWISTKTYTNGLESTTYIEKDKITGKSPFAPLDTENWIYDENTNCIYYKTKVTVGDEQILNATHEFKLDSEYFYESSPSTSYREHVIVHVSYYVDIVQANRAEKKWQVDFEDLGIE